MTREKAPVSTFSSLKEGEIAEGGQALGGGGGAGKGEAGKGYILHKLKEG